jgi:hypothetical protein
MAGFLPRQVSLRLAPGQVQPSSKSVPGFYEGIDSRLLIWRGAVVHLQEAIGYS